MKEELKTAKNCGHRDRKTALARMSRHRFYESLYETVDIWTPTLELKGYLEPGKRRRADDYNGLEPSAASSGNPPSKAPRTATVAAALRHRLVKAEPAGGTPVKTEPGAEEAMEAALPLSRRPKAGNR